MMELFTPNQELLSTKARITIDLIKDGEEFLEQFDINREFLLRTVSIVYRFLRASGKIPHNTFKFFIAAYYIVSRHYSAFPEHQSKKEFCKQFGMVPSSLDYCVEKIVGILGFKKMLDDKNFPYFFNPKYDVGYSHIKSVTKKIVRSALMEFYLKNQPINPLILSEELASKIILRNKSFPNGLFRQFYEIIFEIIEKELNNYDNYKKLQEKTLIHF